MMNDLTDGPNVVNSVIGGHFYFKTSAAHIFNLKSNNAKQLLVTPMPILFIYLNKSNALLQLVAGLERSSRDFRGGTGAGGGGGRRGENDRFTWAVLVTGCSAVIYNEARDETSVARLLREKTKHQ